MCLYLHVHGVVTLVFDLVGLVAEVEVVRLQLFGVVLIIDLLRAMRPKVAHGFTLVSLAVLPEGEVSGFGSGSSMEEIGYI